MRRNAWTVALAVLMVLIAWVDAMLPQDVVALVYLVVPVLLAAAFAGPQRTGLLAAWGVLLYLLSGLVSDYYPDLNYWLRLIATVMVVVIAVILASRTTARLDRETHRASIDPLTGLANRRTVKEELYRVLADRRRSRALGVLYVDLDGFKEVNTQFGHSGGDAVLREVAYRLCDAVRQGDTVARFGGDEFVVLAPQLQEASQLRLLANRIREQIAHPFSNPAAVIGASVGGMVVLPGTDPDPEDVLHRADELLMNLKSQEPGGAGRTGLSTGVVRDQRLGGIRFPALSHRRDPAPVAEVGALRGQHQQCDHR